MSRRQTNCNRLPCGAARRVLRLELLESRWLLNAGAEFHHVIFGASGGGVPFSSSLPPATALTPAQICAAYGINNTLPGFGDGTGQTIAIIDAYDDPTIAADLATFDAQFNLPAPPSFTKLNQNGGTTLPGTDPTGAGNPKGTWEEEEALDVEWAHAIAPGANIILFEANSNYPSDLNTAVDTARNMAGVSVVSMSWGSSEWSGETSYDYHFTTPSGHAGVTFVASTGDSGSPGGYPAYSPNVLAVGGTSLTLSNGNYGSETAWSGSGGGQSAYESEPSYQNGVQSSGKRQIPDVAFDADPNTGVAMCDSYDGGSKPWYQIGGTSLSAPCWAGLIAIANQRRVSQGMTTLDGRSQALPAIYNLSASDFHDIITGSNGGFSAHAGYDEVTGLGTPVANTLVADLAGVPAVPDLTVALSHFGNFHRGDVGDTYTITVSNIGGGPTKGTVSVVDTLPTGLTATAMSGTGWTVNLSTLTATRSDVLAGGTSFPALTLTVNVAANAPTSVVNTATVSGGGEVNTANDTASDPTAIALPAVSGSTPSLAGGTLTAGATTLAVNFNEAVLGAGNAANYQLQSVGADGLLGTADDVIVPLSVSYSGATATVTFAPLVESVYRFTVDDAITDSSGVKLDGNGDGVPGGNWVSDFVVLPSTTSLLGAVTTYASAGTTPYSVAVGDFNGDGKPDLAAANYGGNNVAVLLNNGNGTYSAGTTLTGLSHPYAVAAADFNGDGKADLAVANSGGNNVVIFLGNGDGTFASGVGYNSGGFSGPRSIALGDFNGDGKPDIAAGNYSNNTVGILLNNGNGTFAAATTLTASLSHPYAVAVADFNGDGKADVAVANNGGNSVVTFRGNGNGTFASGVSHSTGSGSGPRSLAIADFNGDGKPDIAVANYSNNTVGILLNNGSGSFLAIATYSAGSNSGPEGVAVGDFNGDGKPDIAVANYGNSTLGILLNNGGGTFSAITTYSPGGSNPYGVALGDFNGDGRPDVAVANSASTSNSVGVLLNVYGLLPVAMTSPNSFVFDVATGDFGDGEFVTGTGNAFNNAFNGYGRLSIGGVPFQAAAQTYTSGNGGQTLTTAAGTADGLVVNRQICVPNTGSDDFARTLDVLTNPTGAAITTTVQIVGNLGSNAATTVFATSDGTGVVSPNDQWIGTDGGNSSSTPAIIHYLHGPTGLQPDSVSTIGDNIQWTYTVTVPAGATVRLVYFTILATSRAAAITEANALVTSSGFGDQAAAFLSPTELSSLANFGWLSAGAVTPPGVVTEGSGFTTALLFHFGDSSPAPNIDSYSATITWGDHTTSTVTSTASLAGQIVAHNPSDPSQGFDVLGSHTYAEELAAGTLSVQVTNGLATVAGSGTVSVADAPLVATGGLNVGFQQGQPFNDQAVATFVDPGGAELPAADYSATIDWGDGTPPSTGTISLSNGTFTVQGSHTYSAQSLGSPYPVVVSIVHDGMAPVVVDSTASITGPHTMVWNAQATGDWASASWENGPPTYPDAQIDAVIDTPAAVTVDSVQTANSLTVSAGAVLVVAAGGTLTINNATTIGAGSAIDVLSGGTLAVSALNFADNTSSVGIDGGTLQADASFVTAVPFAIGSNGATVNTNGFVVTFNGNISNSAGSDGFTVTGTGTLNVLSVAGTGNTTVGSGATLQFNYIQQHQLTVGIGGKVVLGGVGSGAGPLNATTANGNAALSPTASTSAPAAATTSTVVAPASAPVAVVPTSSADIRLPYNSANAHGNPIVTTPDLHKRRQEPATATSHNSAVSAIRRNQATVPASWIESHAIVWEQYLSTSSLDEVPGLSDVVRAHRKHRLQSGSIPLGVAADEVFALYDEWQLD